MPPPGQWDNWLIMAGRGFGKTRTGAETVRMWAETGAGMRIALVGRTAADARDVMVEGESGILAVSPPWFMPRYEPSKRRLTWPNDARATTYSGDKPDQLRGPQHDKAWADELAAWRYADAFDQLQFGLRLGDSPQAIFTTTPRPTPLMIALTKDPRTVVTTGSTFENQSNLPQRVLAKLLDKYGDTRLGQQELYAALLTDIPGALWQRQLLEDTRVRAAPDIKRVVVAIDPAVTYNEDTSNETGIIVCGLGADKHGYVLEDISLQASPSEWGQVAVDAYHRWEADRIVAETNQGGDMVEHVIRQIDRNVAYKGVRASKGKTTRAEPVAALYEQRRCHHVGMFAELEDQLCTWVQGDKDSPDRLDALVWALTELMLHDNEVKTYKRNPFFY